MSSVLESSVISQTGQYKPCVMQELNSACVTDVWELVEGCWWAVCGGLRWASRGCVLVDVTDVGKDLVQKRNYRELLACLNFLIDPNQNSLHVWQTSTVVAKPRGEVLKSDLNIKLYLNCMRTFIFLATHVILLLPHWNLNLCLKISKEGVVWYEEQDIKLQDCSSWNTWPLIYLTRMRFCWSNIFWIKLTLLEMSMSMQNLHQDCSWYAKGDLFQSVQCSPYVSVTRQKSIQSYYFVQSFTSLF